MSKQILYDGEARIRLKSGMDLLTKSVAVTLGPRGRNVIIKKKYGKPVVTKDGVSVAKEINLSGRFENIGVELLKKVAEKTGKEAGDGTTTSIVLAHEIIHGGIKNLIAGANPMDLKRGIDIAVEKVTDSLSKMAKPINSDKKEIEFIATISANNDKAIGSLIAESYSKVGKNGLITIEEGKGKESKIELKEGMQFDRGFVSPYLVTNKTKMETILERPYVLIYDKKLSEIKDVLPVLEECLEKKVSLLIIAENIEDTALSTIILNSLRGIIKIGAIKAPGFGDNRKEILEDIAVFCGGTVLSQDTGNLIKNASLASLGRIDKAIISKDTTALILNRKGKSEGINLRINNIKARLDNNPKQYDKEKLEERLARLTGSIAVIKIGALTEIELKEKKERCDDALKSTRAALEEGIVPGGGVAYLKCIQKLEKISATNSDQETGIQLVKKALEKPLRIIAQNAGYEATVVIQKVLESEDNIGFNAQNLQYENFITSGIIDPAKIARIALQNATSIAGVFLTLECAITETQKVS